MERVNEDAVRTRIADSILVKARMLEDAALIQLVVRVAEECTEALERGNRILFAGNGGSAADAQHLAAELVSRFAFDRRGLAGIALTTDTSVLTAVSNDYGYEQVFRRQLEAHGRSGDVFVAISTSGNSPNILEALQAARALGIRSVGLTGAAGGRMAALCDFCLRVPAEDTARTQECHILLGHVLCGLIEQAMFGRGGRHAGDRIGRGTGHAAALGGS